MGEQTWSQQPLPPTFISIPLSPQERWIFKPLSIYLRLQVSRRGNLEDCFQQRVLLFAFTEEKMIACSLTVALFLLSSTSAAGEVNMKRMENRDGLGKLFWVSTSSTTTTLETTTQCVKTSAAAACGKKKRKRSIVTHLPAEDSEEILPSRGSQDEVMEEVEDLLEAESIISGDRMPRFLLYWKTTTDTSTSTSYTATSTLATAACTPSGFALSPC